MPALLRPAVLPVCAVASGGGGGSDKWAPRQQRSWWGRSKQSLPHQPGGKGGGGPLDQVFGVLRRDTEFLQSAAGGPLRDALWLRFLEKKKQHQRGNTQPKPKPAQQQKEEEAPPPRATAFPSYPPGLSCVELVMADLQALKVYADSSKQELVLRFLGSKQQPQSEQQPAKPKPVFQKQPKPKPKPDEQQKKQQALQAPAFPPHSYPPGLSCMELMMADLDALKVYVNYFLAILTTPLPQHYDPDLLAQYFVSRPHILVFRTVEILFAFLVGAVKVQMFKRANLNTDATHSSSVSNNGFNASQYMVGQLLKDTFIDLGPTFVKVGQSLSTRPDIIGSEISEALAELHERVPSFPREDAMEIIEGEFQCPVSQVFRYISDEPVAAASFGQVYQGRTVDGALVAIKVQRPNLLPSVLRDIYILRLGLSIVRKVAKRRSNISLYADELGRGFVDELDYNIEAANATKFLETHSKYPFIVVPKILKQLTRKRVLTMEWVAGENPRELLSLSKGISGNTTELSEKQKLEAKGRLLDLVNKGVEASLVQLLDTGLLHADPHPGNLRYTPDGRVGFLDFGLLCEMEKKHKHAMLSSIVHIVNGDWASLVYDLTEMDVVPPRTNLRRVTMDTKHARQQKPDRRSSVSTGESSYSSFDQPLPSTLPSGYRTTVATPSSSTIGVVMSPGLVIYCATRLFYYSLFHNDLEDALGEVTFEDGIPDIKFSRVLGRIWSIALKYHFRMPPYYTLVLRSLASLEGLAMAGDGSFKTFQAAYPYVVRKLLSDNSLETRKVLHQVIFNRRKEFQWHKIAVFLKLASARSNVRQNTGVLPERNDVDVSSLAEISDASSLDRATPEKALHTANLCLKLLLSRESIVIRRLIMTANIKSLAQDLISKDATIFRVLLSRVLADVVCKWMVKVTGLKRLTRLTSTVLSSLQEAVGDRRLKVIFSKFLRDLRQEPILMVRVSWNALAVSAVSVAIGVHRFVVLLSEEYLPMLWTPAPPPSRLVQV